MADNDLSSLEQQSTRAQQEAVDAQNQFVEKQKVYQQLLNELAKSGQLNLKEGADLAKVEKLLNQVLQERIKQEQLRKKIVDEVTKSDKKLAEAKAQEANIAKARVEQERKILEEAKKPKGFNAFLERIGFTDKKDGLESRYASDQVSRGLNNLFEGRIISGVTELAKSSVKVANFMGGPYYAAMVAAAKATIALVDGIGKFSVTSNRLAGNTDTEGKKFGAWRDRKAFALMYNQKESDIINYSMSSLGRGKREQFFNDPQFMNTYYSMRAGLEHVGADPNKANSLISQQLSVGLSPAAMRRFNYELIKTTKTLDVMSSNKFLDIYEELNKTLIANNVNGMANAKTLAQFQDALNKGTLSANDFARSLTSRRTSETSTLAGVGALLAERGLGGEELQQAYASGDMIKVAGIMRRGGRQISMGIERLETDFAQDLMHMGISGDIRELLAMQSDTAWGRLGPDLKKIDVQNILSRGGTLTVGTTATNLPTTDKDKKDLKDYEFDLIDESVKLKNSFQALGESVMLLAANIAASFEEGGNVNKSARSNIGSTNNIGSYSANNTTVTMNPYARYDHRVMNQSQLDSEQN